MFNGIVVRKSQAPEMAIKFDEVQAPLISQACSEHLPVHVSANTNQVLVTREFTLDGPGPVKGLSLVLMDRFILSCDTKDGRAFKIGVYHLPRGINEEMLPDEPDEVIGRFVTNSLDSAKGYLEVVATRINTVSEDLKHTFAVTGIELSVQFDEVKVSNDCA